MRFFIFYFISQSLSVGMLTNPYSTSFNGISINRQLLLEAKSVESSPISRVSPMKMFDSCMACLVVGLRIR